MSSLHIHRSPPDDDVRELIELSASLDGAVTVSLADGPVDYDELVRRIFDADRVICWW